MMSYIQIFYDMKDAISVLSGEDVKWIILTALEYGETGELPTEDEIPSYGAKIFWYNYRSILKNSKKKYDARCEKSKKSAEKRWDSKSATKDENANADNTKESLPSVPIATGVGSPSKSSSSDERIFY